MVRKHSAKVLTLRNVERAFSGVEETLHFVLIGGNWIYNGASSLTFLSNSSSDGFWGYDIKYILENNPAFSYEDVIKCFYHGPNKSLQIATREWTSNQRVYGAPF